MIYIYHTNKKNIKIKKINSYQILYVHLINNKNITIKINLIYFYQISLILINKKYTDNYFSKIKIKFNKH